MGDYFHIRQQNRRRWLCIICTLGLLCSLYISSAAADFSAASTPDPACYGRVSVDNAAEILQVIEDARSSGLLTETETVAFDPDAEFYRGIYSRDIEYYLDDSILAILWKEKIDGKCCSFAEIKIADAAQFQRKLTEDRYGSDLQVFASVLSAEVNAVVAMNADLYRPREFGIVINDGELCRFNTGIYTGSYSLYNCVDTMFVNENGDFLYKRLGEINTPESIQAFVRENSIRFSLAFGPVLVMDGRAIPCDWYPLGEVGLGYSRAGIGQMGERHYLYMSLNHGDHEARWTVTEFARHFAEKPVLSAYCLDGGQTGEVLIHNEPYNYIDFGKERTVSDILYFASAGT